MAIAVTYLQEWEDSPRNIVSIIDRFGEIKLEYAKVHTCDFGAEALLPLLPCSTHKARQFRWGR